MISTGIKPGWHRANRIYFLLKLRCVWSAIDRNIPDSNHKERKKVLGIEYFLKTDFKNILFTSYDTVMISTVYGMRREN